MIRWKVNCEAEGPHPQRRRSRTRHSRRLRLSSYTHTAVCRMYGTFANPEIPLLLSPPFFSHSTTLLTRHTHPQNTKVDEVMGGQRQSPRTADFSSDAMEGWIERENNHYYIVLLINFYESGHAQNTQNHKQRSSKVHRSSARVHLRISAC